MIRSMTVASVIAVAIFLSLHDLLFGIGGSSAGQSVGKGNEESFADFKHSVPQPKMKSRMSGPTLKVLYCYSCGYQRAFEEFSRIVQERHPTLVVEGANYPTSPLKQMLIQFLSVAKFGLIAAVLFGFDPFAAVGLGTPGILQWAFQNKLYACMMAFFLSNAVEGQLNSSGAFEISLNDVPVWSKLEVGHIPSVPEVLQIIESQMKMSGGFGGHNL